MPITDLTPYRQHLDEFDLTEEQKLELVNTIWLIGKTILDKRFGLHQPPHLAQAERQPLTNEGMVSSVADGTVVNRSGV